MTEIPDNSMPDSVLRLLDEVIHLDAVDGIMGLLDSVPTAFAISEHYVENSQNEVSDTDSSEDEPSFILDTKIASIGSVLHLVRRNEDEVLYLVVASPSSDFAESYVTFKEYLNSTIDEHNGEFDEDEFEGDDFEQEVRVVYNWENEILPCLKSKKQLAHILTDISLAFQEYEEYFFVYSDTVVPLGYYQHDKKGLEEVFKKFIKDVEKIIIPRMKITKA